MKHVGPFQIFVGSKSADCERPEPTAGEGGYLKNANVVAELRGARKAKNLNAHPALFEPVK
jgi:hypothetical protein